MLIFFIIFTIGIQNRMYIAQVQQNEQIALELASVINNEAILAASVHSGYSREFILPVLVDGSNYSLELYDDQDLFIFYRGTSYLFFLDTSLMNTSPLGPGKNNIINS